MREMMVDAHVRPAAGIVPMRTLSNARLRAHGLAIAQAGDLLSAVSCAGRPMGAHPL